MEKDIKKMALQKSMTIVDTCLKNAYNQLVRLNSNIFLMKKILYFPFELLYPGHELHFWKLIYAALYESSTLLIWHFVDPNPKALSLNKLKNIIRQCLSENKRNQFDKTLKKIGSKGFNKIIKEIRNDIEEIRHKKIAHFETEWWSKVSFEKLKKVFPPVSQLENHTKTLIRLFEQIAGFVWEGGRSYLPLEYNPQVEHPAGLEPDICWLLKLMAKESPLLNMPEKEPEYWKSLQKKLSGDEIKKLNLFRIKLGLLPK